MLKHALLLTVLCLYLTAAHAAGGPAGYWRFNSANAQVPDLSGHNHTATLTGGQVVTENGQSFLRMDGSAKVLVPSAPDLCLSRGFTIEARLRPSDLSDGRLLVAKDNEYLLRVDWPVETTKLSFFTYLGEIWEPRVSAAKPNLNAWYHIVATWNGTQLQLWVNGLPQQASRIGDPKPTDNPVCIGGGAGLGKGFVGDFDYVKIYNRAMTSGEVITAAYGAGGKPLCAPSAASSFNFRGSNGGWAGREGATLSPTPAGLEVQTPTATSLAMHDRLNVDLAKGDFVNLRMSVDQGSRGALVFITDRSAGRMPFSVIADGQMHTYVLEPWQFPGWSGKLTALGLSPSETTNAKAKLQYMRVTNEPQAEGEISLLGLTTDAVLPRANRTEKLTLRLLNTGGPASAVKVTLKAPEGIRLAGPATQTIPTLGYQQQKDVVWTIQPAKAMNATFSVEATAADITPVSLSTQIRFQPAMAVVKASYVPVPKPAKMGKYEVWTHYCPLWKQGTHMGWGKIEPYPERKPVLGWYNEGTPEVADWHIKYWLEHGISAVMYCWYRANLNAPVVEHIGHALNDGMLHARYLSMIKFGIMWENGCAQGVGSTEDMMTNVLPYWLNNYFTNPSYLKVDGKPVLYIWVPGNVTKNLGGDSDKVRAMFDAMRAKAVERGLKGLYIVGCVGTADRNTLERMAKEGWDASSSYGNSWIPPANLKSVGNFVCAPYEGFVDQQEALWKAKTQFNILPDITAAMMGWDSRPWNETAFFWSENTPEKFRDLCQRAKAALDAKTTSGPEKNTAIFCCWNEFGEGHYIEPTRGNGFSYLDAIRDTFSEADPKHSDVAPEDVALGPYDSWYQQARKLAAAGTGTVTQTSWTGAALGAWNASGGLDHATVKDGLWSAQSSTTDPIMSIGGLKLRGNRFVKVTIDMRVSQPSQAQLFWTTTGMPGAQESASVQVPAIADGQFHSYTFEVGKNENWGGCVTGFRFDPTSLSGVTVEIRSIEVQ